MSTPILRLVPAGAGQSAAGANEHDARLHLEEEIKMLRATIRLVYDALQRDANRETSAAYAPKLARLVDTLIRALAAGQKLDIGRSEQTRLRDEIERIFSELAIARE
jgi:hypothetical protein